MDSNRPRESLALITTDWQIVVDPMQFVLRYSTAIRGYLQILLPTSADIDEVLQEFLLNALERGFAPQRVRRGRFRDYLIATIRYRAWRYLRRKLPRPLSDEQAAGLPTREPFAQEDREWLAAWRRCLLERAWDVLEDKQRRSPGNWHYSALKLASDQPHADSKSLAAQIGANPPMSAVAFRKQLSRARTAFAQALVHEVERTLEKPTAEVVREELADIGLLNFVRPYLKW